MYFGIVCRFILFCFCIEKITMSSNRPINWSKSTIKSISNNERMLYHPAYNEATPALCDLTEDCDICCSDPDCRQYDKEIFNCTSNEEVQSDYDSLECDKNHIHSMHTDWFQLLCYVTVNSPYLGQYFIEMKKIDSLPVLNAALEQKERKYTFYDDTNLPSDAVTRYSQYMYGEPIMLIWNMGSDFPLRYSNFELPQNLLSIGSGSCVHSQEVKYLVNSDATCVRKISKDICNNNTSSYLSVAPYALLGEEDFFTFQLPTVAKGKFSIDSTETLTKYLCLKNGSDYVTFSKSIFLKTVAAQLDYTVSEDSNTTECEDVNDQLLSASYNEATNVCENVLVSAHYNFIWKGSEIVMLNIVYMLADVLLPEISVQKGIKTAATGGVGTIDSPILSDTTELYVTQHLSISFRYYSFNSSIYNETVTN